jgi:hypothetical protein
MPTRVLNRKDRDTYTALRLCSAGEIAKKIIKRSALGALGG